MTHERLNTSPVEVTVTPVSDAERPALEQLFELYTYDFSEVIDLDVGPNGRYAARDLSVYWSDERRHPFFIRVNGRLAGFALVHVWSRLTNDASATDLSEFFVMRKYRRHGVGARAAFAVFNRFPGTWEVRELHTNTAAIAFWRRVIHTFTSGRFEDLVWDTDAWRGPVQRFSR